jgi:hypothetical protein
MPQITPSASLCPLSLALMPAISKPKIARCASPLAYCPVYTAPTPKGKNPARIPATVGFGPLPLMWGGAGGGGICPKAAGAPIVPNVEEAGRKPAETDPAGTPSIFAPRQSSQ